MKKVISIVFAFTSVFMSTLLKAQQNLGIGGVPNVTTINTDPANISQLQVEGKLITQNSFSVTSGVQRTGSFDATARWNSMGNLNAGSQTLNGFRTQTNGRALAWGHSINNSTSVLSNPFIQWGGNSGASVTPGNLEFRSFTSPSSTSADSRFSIRGADGTALFGASTANEFTDPLFEINGTTATGLGISNNNAAASVVYGVRSNCNGTANGTTGFGVYGNAVNYNTGYGLYGRATGGGDNTFAIGVEALAKDGESNIAVNANALGTANAFGVYSQVPSAGGNSVFAGVFLGTLFASSTIFPSDIRLKKDVLPLQDALGLLKKLAPVNYYYNTEKSPKLNLPNNLQYGFIAQEVEKVMPELINDIPPTIDTKGKIEGNEKYKGLNYIQLIAILTKAIQEQQIQIELLTQKMNTQSKQTSTLIKTDTEASKALEANSYVLAQNVPNPFTQITTIKYSIPNKTTA